MTIDYHLSLADPDTHEFEIRLTLDATEANTLRLSLPAWIPGSYMIRDFARNLLAIRAIDASGKALELRKLDKQTWELDASVGANHVTYRVYAFDPSVRSAYFDSTRAYFNGTSLFLRVLGSENLPHRLQIENAELSCMSTWQVATGMPALSVDSAGFGLYQCDGYEALIDYPFEIADLDCGVFKVGAIPHRVVFSDARGADVEKIARDLELICAEHAAMFGELPVNDYLFMTLATADGYGGLEHRNSTSLVCKRSDLPYPNTRKIEKGYRTFLALCSHEYFHLWNVKRIRPAVFEGLPLHAEVHTELLWAFEGITSYYDELALPRAGVISRDQYLDMLAPALSRYFRNPGRYRQSVAESSFDAWTKFYKQDENAVNAIVSYYNKGALIALGLDVLIRINSQDRLSLDDLMRQLWDRFGRTGLGIPERGLEQQVAEMLDTSVDDFFQSYVYGTEELPLDDWLAHLGIGLVRRGARDAADQGGFVASVVDGEDAPATLQAITEETAGVLRVVRLTNGGAGQRAGLAAGDQLVAIERERVTAANLGELLNRKPLGDRVEISYFRRDLLRQATLVLEAKADDTCDLYWLEEDRVAESVVSRRDAWLASVLPSAQGD